MTLHIESSESDKGKKEAAVRKRDEEEEEKAALGGKFRGGGGESHGREGRESNGLAEGMML